MAGDLGRWGWHQLDRHWASWLVHAANVERGDLVLDIGAGAGAITDQLVAVGATVVAIELHPERVAALRSRFADQRVTVVRADAVELRLPRRPFKVVANPPFAITTALLRRITKADSHMDKAALVLPAWAAARWHAGRGVGGVVSKRTFHFALGPRIPARAFCPPTPGGAAVLLIQRWDRPAAPASSRRGRE